MEDNNTVSSEDVVSKYKRLLSLARSSLEANQLALAEKDKLIAQYKAQLESNDSNIYIGSSYGKRNSQGIFSKEDESKYPRRLLRRVDVEDKIWLLVEYSAGIDDSWILFSEERDLFEFVKRIPGEPLAIPHKSLTPSESNNIVSSFETILRY